MFLSLFDNLSFTSSYGGATMQSAENRRKPILVTLTSRSDSDFESLNISLKENKPDGVNPNSNDIDFYVQKNEGKIRRFSAD